MSPIKGLDAPTIMRIGAARLTAGLDRMPRLDLEAHRDIFGPLPRLSAEELISMSEQVDLRGQGGAAFPFARKLSAVVTNAEASDCAPIVVVNATEGEPGSVKDKMLMIRSPYLILSGAALVAEAIGAEEIVVGVSGNELANRSMEAAIAAEPGLRKIARIVRLPDRFISGESGALVRGINGKRPVPPGRKVLVSDFGVGDLPTLLSNAATFAQLAVLALLGPERFAAVGTPEEPGTVLLSVGGSAAHQAVVEVPTGVPLAAVLDICQAPAGDGVSGRRIPRHVAACRYGVCGAAVPRRPGRRRRHSRLGDRAPARRRDLPTGRSVTDCELPSWRVGGPVRPVQARTALDRTGAGLADRRIWRHRGAGCGQAVCRGCSRAWCLLSP